MKNLKLENYGIKHNQECIVIIFLYKEKLDDYERKNLILIEKYLSNYQIIAFMPKSLEVENPMKYSKEIYIDRKNFSNIKAYNKIMMATDFYKIFNGYSKKILVVQSDVTIISNNLGKFLTYDYPIIGARWEDPISIMPIFGRRLKFLHKIWPIRVVCKNSIYPNGGLSLRDVKKVIQKLKYSIMKYIWIDSEDVFYSYIFNEELLFKYDEEIIDNFSQESAGKYIKNYQEDVFGYHGLQVVNIDLLKEIFKKNNL